MTSIIVNPATDPHSYEPTARDARTIAGAQMAIVNGLGYDAWAPRLLRASPSAGRVVLDVGKALGLARRGQPAPVVLAERRAPRDRRDRRRLRPARPERRRLLRAAQAGLPRRTASLATTRCDARSARATPASRSATARASSRPLGEDLGLKLLTPYGFAKAIAEGTDVTAQDKQTVDDQARERRIKVWVFNSQNVTPDVQRVNEIARAAADPDRDRDRDARARRRQLPAVAGRRSSKASRERCTRRAGR